MPYYDGEGSTIKRAAIYLRISQERGSTRTYATDAIERQREDCEALCAWRRWEVAGVYIDRARSAFSEKERPEYERMLADYRAGAFDVIVAWKLDRIMRRVGSLVDMVRNAPDVRFCTDDLGLLDLTTPDGRHRAIEAANNAEFESARKGERERRANRQHAEQGKPKRGPQRCFGYTHDRKIVPEEAALVRALYDARVAGYPLHDLLRAVNGEETVNALDDVKKAVSGLQSPQKWSYTRLRYCISNPKYAGFIAHVSEPTGSGPRRQRTMEMLDHLVRDRDGNLVHGDWEPIVDEATWRESVRMTRDAARGRQPGRRIHFGTGIFRCGVCGKPLHVAGGSYRCPERGHVSRTEKPVNELVLATIRDDYRAHLIDGEFYAEIREEQVARRDRLLAERECASVDPTGGVLTGDDPVAAFDAIADDPVRLNAVVDYLVEVTIDPFHRDRKRGQRTFVYDGIHIKWREH